MVNIRTQIAEMLSDEDATVEWLSAQLRYLDDPAQGRVLDALRWILTTPLDLAVPTGDWVGVSEPLDHGLEVLQILAELQLDADTLIAGLCYRPLREQRISLDRIEANLGSSVTQILDGVVRMAAVSELRRPRETAVLGQTVSASDNVRRMLVAMIDDVRIALVKRAERTVVMRLLKTASRPKQLQIAQEIQDVYAPLALRLGVGQLKWELEDLAFRYLQPDAYHRIAKMLDGRRLDRDHYIGRVQRLLEDELTAAGLQFQLTGRSKHISSIYRKMQRKGVGFSQIYDIRAVRILVSSVAKCYQVLGVIHGLWRSIPNEFDDYIANPKENGYRSLHTAVVGPEGRVLEIQIRTHSMHEDAELGVCAHWRYKDGESDRDRGEGSYQDKLEWLRQVLEWHEGVGGEQAQLRFEAYDERIYVFTPQGDVVSLAQGATALDFAYHVHTEIGHRCRRAKVDGVLTPLTTPLQTGQRVEIITAEDPQPRREWLYSSAGYLKTARARARVHEWFSVQTREDHIAAGRQLMERECARLALTVLDYSAIAQAFRRASVEDLFYALGSAELSVSEIFRVVQYLGRGSDQFRAVLPPSLLVFPIRTDCRFDAAGHLLVNYARCCMPMAPEAITGFVTRSRGVSVHRSSCHRIAIAEDSAPDQLIELMWAEVATAPRQTDIALEADDRQGLLVDITSVLSGEGVNIIAVQTQTDTQTLLASMRLRIEVSSLDVLASVLSRLAEIDGMRSAQRLRLEASDGDADNG